MNTDNKIADKPCIFLVGGTGAGKTELALNFSVYYATLHGSCNLLDLDIVNPYFRVRQFLKTIAEKNVKIICPGEKVMFGDVPALPPAAWGAIQQRDVSVVCDVGGGEPGLRLLGRMKEVAKTRNSSVYFVLNPFRPDYINPEDIEKEFKHTCELCQLNVSSIVANPNLSDHTTVEDFKEGLETTKKLSKKTGIDISFCVATQKLAKELGVKSDKIPGFYEYEDMKLFIPERYWSVPWHFGVVEEEKEEIGN